MVLWLGYGLDHREIGVRFPVGEENISSPKFPDRSANPVRMGAGFPKVKRSGRGADHSYPSTANADNAWRYTSSPSYAFIMWCFTNHKHKFILVKSFLRYVQTRYKLYRCIFQKSCNSSFLSVTHLSLRHLNISFCFSGESIHSNQTLHVRGRSPIPLLCPRHWRQYHCCSR
jgi:hypothetical protein